MDLQVGPEAYEFAQEIRETAGQAVERLAVGANQRGAAVDVPADHEDTALGLQAGASDGLEEGGGVDQHCGPVGPLDPPDVVIRPQESHRP